MKRLLLIPLFIITLWLIIYFTNQNVDKITTIRDIKIYNLTNNTVNIKLNKDLNIVEEKTLGKNDNYLFRIGKLNDSNTFKDFLLLNNSYKKNYEKIFNKMQKGEIYNDIIGEIYYENQDITSSERYFPFYIKRIINIQKFIIKIK